MLEKLSTSLLAGVPAIVKPSPYSSYLTNEVFKDMIESGYLPEGAVQLVCGEPGNILDFVKDGDSVVFTGSANTGRKLKALPSISGNAVRFNMEADSLNCSILGLDAKPGTPEFDLFIKEVKNEMTTKAGQKCTAIRRIIVPENLVGDVQNALSKALDATKIGNPFLFKIPATGNRPMTFEVTGLPEGLNKSINGNTLTISGTPATDANYTVKATGGMTTLTISGNIIRVIPTKVLTGDWYHIQDTFTAPIVQPAGTVPASEYPGFQTTG
jgi:hypothetical protein